MSKPDIERAFAELAAELGHAGLQVDLAVTGGAALVLLFGARESTKDVDALVLPPMRSTELRIHVQRVGERLALPADWLNDAAKGYVHKLALGDVVFQSPSLRVTALAPEQLLAMKLSAWRDDIDIEDARLLLSKLAGDQATIWHAVERHLVPGRELKARYAFDDVWEADRGST